MHHTSLPPGVTIHGFTSLPTKEELVAMGAVSDMARAVASLLDLRSVSVGIIEAGFGWTDRDGSVLEVDVRRSALAGKEWRGAVLDAAYVSFRDMTLGGWCSRTFGYGWRLSMVGVGIAATLALPAAMISRVFVGGVGAFWCFDAFLVAAMFYFTFFEMVIRKRRRRFALYYLSRLLGVARGEFDAVAAY